MIIKAINKMTRLIRLISISMILNKNSFCMLTYDT